MRLTASPIPEPAPARSGHDGNGWGNAAWIASPQPWGKREPFADDELGDWIRPGQQRNGRTERLVRVFELPKPLDLAEADVAFAVNDVAAGSVELKINDSRLPNFGYRTHDTADERCPPWPAVQGDLLAFLKPGRNVVWFEARSTADNTGPAVSARFSWTHADGRRDGFSTDASWRWLRDGMPESLWCTPPSLGGTGEFEQVDHRTLIVELAAEAPPVVACDGRPACSLLKPWPKPHGVHRLAGAADLPQPAVGGCVFLAARGYASVHIDGEVVGGSRRLDPAPSNYDRTAYRVDLPFHQTLDASVHTIEIELAEGWAGQDRVWVGGLPGSHAMPEGIGFGKPAAKLAVRFDHANGTHTWRTTDATWTATTTEITAANLYAGETHDRVQAQAKAKPAPVEVLPLDDLATPPQPIGPCVVAETLTVARRTQPAPGVHVLDFGRNVAGHVALTLDTAPGQTVRIRHAERLTPDGTLDTLSTGVRATRVEQRHAFRCAGGPRERLSPRHTYQGFRYVQVTADPPLNPADLDAAVAEVVHTQTQPAGDVITSDPTLHRILAAARTSFLGNLHGVLTDCPHRERGAWHADIEIACELGLYAFETRDVYRKSLLDTLDTLDDHGMPYYLSVGRRLHPPSRDIGWVSVVAEVAWRLYAMCGDGATLRLTYPTSRRVAETMLRRTQDGLLRDAAWGDHAPPLRDAQGDRIPPCPLVLYASFKLFEMLRTLRRTAYALGHTDDARYFADRAVSLRRAIIELAFNDEGFGHPVADAWALNLGVHPARGRSTLLAALREALQRHGGINPGGFFGHVQILDALFRFGTAREAIESMTCDRFPGVAWSLKHDEATSIYETFAEPGSLLYRERSANHPPYGAQAALLWSRLLGIRPRVHDCAGDTRYAHGGFARISLCPRPDAGLTRAEGWHSTPHGRVAVSLCESDDGYDWTVHLPPRTTARVHLPEGWRYASATAPKPNSLLGPGEHRFHLARERTFQEA